MPEKIPSIEQRNQNKAESIRSILETIKGAGEGDEKENAIKNLEKEFANSANLENSVIQKVFDNVDDNVRQRLIKTVINSSNLKGELMMKDSTGKWLKVELDNEPIKQDSIHGWVIRYRVKEVEEIDSKSGKKIMTKTAGNNAAAVRKNYIPGFVNFKNLSDAELTEQKRAA